MLEWLFPFFIFCLAFKVREYCWWNCVIDSQTALGRNKVEDDNISVIFNWIAEHWYGFKTYTELRVCIRSYFYWIWSNSLVCDCTLHCGVVHWIPHIMCEKYLIHQEFSSLHLHIPYCQKHIVWMVLHICFIVRLSRISVHWSQHGWWWFPLHNIFLYRCFFSCSSGVGCQILGYY